MRCNKCGGKVFIDRVLSQLDYIECSCICCGKRWVFSKTKSATGRWLNQIEQRRDLAL